MRAKGAALCAALCVLSFSLGRFSVWQGAAAGTHEPADIPALEGREPEPAPQEFGKIDLNTAGEELLCLLPGIGPATAEKILEYREQNGPFATAEELMAVSGIGAATYENIRQYVCVGR